MLFVVHGQAVHHVAEQQKSEVNRSSGMNQRHGIQCQAQTHRVVSLSLVGVAEKHENADDQTQLTRHTGKSRVKGLGEQPQPQPHCEHRISPSPMTVKSTHEAHQKDKQGVVAQMKNRCSSIMAAERGHPCGHRRESRGVGPESFVGSGQTEVTLQHQLLREHCKADPIYAKRQALDHGGEYGGRCDHHAEGHQRRGPVLLELKLNFSFLAQRGGVAFLRDFTVHRCFQHLPSGSFCQNFVALVNQSIRHDIGGQQPRCHQERRPDVEQHKCT